MMVVVVKPECVRDDLDLHDESIKEAVMVKESSAQCPNFEWKDSNTAHCTIHHYPWFKFTPCGTHRQIGEPNDPCRMGVHLTSKLQNLQGYFASQIT